MGYPTAAEGGGEARGGGRGVSGERSGYESQWIFFMKNLKDFLYDFLNVL